MRQSGWVFVAVGALLALLAGCDVSDEPVQTRPAAPAVPIPDGQGHFDFPATAEDHAPPSTKIARGNLHFVEGYHRGYETAVREGKPMLLFFTAQWCHFCHQMAGEAFTDGRVVGLSDRFVCVLIDADAERNVCQQFNVRGYPTIQFMSPRGAPLNRVTGKKAAHQLVSEMHSALQAVARVAQTGEVVR